MTFAMGTASSPASTTRSARRRPGSGRCSSSSVLRRAWRLLRSCAAAGGGFAGRPLPGTDQGRPLRRPGPRRRRLPVRSAGQHRSPARALWRRTGLSLRSLLHPGDIAQALRSRAAVDAAGRRRAGSAVRADAGGSGKRRAHVDRGQRAEGVPGGNSGRRTPSPQQAPGKSGSPITSCRPPSRTW